MSLAESIRHIREYLYGRDPDPLHPEPPPRPAMRFRKLESGTLRTLGRVLEGVLIVEHPRQRFRILLAFTDGTHYEIYGEGWVGGGARAHDGGWDAMKAVLDRDPSVLQVAGWRATWEE